MRARPLLAVAAALAVLLAPCARAQEAAPFTSGYELLNRKAPAFSAPLVGGGAFTERSLVGKWSVVEFWALWCPDSAADLNHAAALARAIDQDRDLEFFTVHVDQRYGRWPSVAAFAADEAIAYPIALDPHGEIKRAFAVAATPTYLVIDPDGVIRAIRRDLRASPEPEGGVKALIKDIAALRAADRAAGRAPN